MGTNIDIVKAQFNKQAKKFDNWEITKNEQVLSSFFMFAGIQSKDRLLDVACGTGAFSIYAANHVDEVYGVDASEGMIDIARKNATLMNLENVEFSCQGGEQIPYEDNFFTTVTSKAAFHHMQQYESVFSEMVRCCKKGGKICIHDIVSFNNEGSDTFFEKLDTLIDISHYLTLSTDTFYALFRKYGVAIEKLHQRTIELDFNHYIEHAVQTEETKKALDDLLDEGLKNPKIAPFFLAKNGQLHFQRKVIDIVGTVL